MGQPAKDNDRRIITRVVNPIEVMEGAGVLVRRALPSGRVPYSEIDPFLLLDFFDSSHPSFKGQAFPRHPHRGFEIITYLLSGEAGHKDDFGNSTVIRGGGLQKITAGRGIWHEEGPSTDDAEPTRGLQLWINLAKKDKRVPPDYQSLEPSEVPVAVADNATIRILAGEGSEVRLHTPAVYLDITVHEGKTHRQAVPSEYQGFVLIVEGRGRFGANGIEAGEGQVLVYGPGGELPVEPSEGEVRFLLAGGKPHGEPVSWNGPFVD